MIKKVLYSTPLILLITGLFFFQKGLEHDPHQLPSALINHPVPNFTLSSWQNNQRFSQHDFKNQMILLHIFATWCETCREELPTLQMITNAPNVNLYGIAYKDNIADLTQWFKTNKNPYQKLGLDIDGKAGIEWGVYGTPETFVIDQQGIIRYKHVGPLTEDIWKNTLQHFF